MEEFTATVSRESQAISDQSDMHAIVRQFLDIYQPYAHSWTALCESISQCLLDQLQRQVSDCETFTSLGALYTDSLSELDQLHKETLNYRRSYVADM